jgi:AAA family ATP:ADP antiporter
LSDAKESGAKRFLGLVEIRRGEAVTVALAAAYSFCLMASNNVLKPYRDALGTAVPHLSSLWGGTLLACVVVLPPYWALVGRLPRQRFIPWVHRAFELVFVVFFFLLHDEKTNFFQPAAKTFYATVSAFNLLVLSQFWGFMADVFSRDQGQRLFAWVAAGGTLGGLISSYVISWTMGGTTGHAPINPAMVVWPTILLLEVASLIARRIAARAAPGEWRPPPHSDLASHLGDVSAGAIAFVRSPYLLAIAGFMFVSLLANAFVYDFQRTLVDHAPELAARAAKTAYFADVNLWQQALALFGQLVVTARLVSFAGLALTLATMPLCAATGLTVFALHPTLAVIKWVQITLRGTDYALAKPAREALFTVVSRIEKYQSKSLIDAGLYRAFDWLDAVAVDLLRGLGAVTMAWLSLPVMAAGAVLATVLARMQKRRLRVPAPLEPVEAP